MKLYDERSEMARMFGELMEFRRRELGMGQKQLAEASGVSLSSISNYAVGRCEPSAWAVARIATALDVSSDWLLGLEDV